MDAAGPGSNLPSPDSLNQDDLATAPISALASSSHASTLAGATANQSPSTTAPTPPAEAPPARELGTIKEELIDRPLEDLKNELSSFFSLSKLLGIENPQDSPEQKVKKQQLLQKFNQLTQEEQAVAEQRYQEQLARKQQQEQEALFKKQQEEAQKAQSVIMPSSPQKGPPDAGGKSKSQAAMQQLKQDRTTIGKLQTAG